MEAANLIVPERAIDAQSLIAYADLVVSAGGTMNREAVALGTPVFTTFAGRMGGVDEALIAAGACGCSPIPPSCRCASASRPIGRPQPARSRAAGRGRARRCRVAVCNALRLPGSTTRCTSDLLSSLGRP